MKYVLWLLITLQSLACALHGCPSCVGRIEQDSPVFFSDDFYKPAQESLHPPSAFAEASADKSLKLPTSPLRASVYVKTTPDTTADGDGGLPDGMSGIAHRATTEASEQRETRRRDKAESDSPDTQEKV